jgi:hypothetical protein
MPLKVPAIPRDTLEDNLPFALFSQQDISVLLRNRAWNALDFRNAQIVFLEEFTRNESGIQLGSGHLSDTFNLTCERVCKILNVALNTKNFISPT